MLEVSPADLKQLEGLMRRAEKPYVRVKALALWNLAQGKTQTEIAAFLRVGRNAIGRWQRRFQEQGLASLNVRPGRGRRRRSQRSEIETYLRQSPRHFGLSQTRWTLRSLAEAVPSLHGFTDSGVWRALQRYGLSYKRGQPLIHSPDPGYSQKRGLERSASGSR
jgi:transposase